MQNFRQAYRPPESAAEPQAAERMKEVELAKPWQRLLAGAIDRILPIMLLVMFLLRIEYTRAYVQAEMPWLLLLLPVGLVAGLLLGVAQVFMMSRSGQSIGQKILRIRVITDTGANPGFAKYVLAREGFSLWCCLRCAGCSAAWVWAVLFIARCNCCIWLCCAASAAIIKRRRI